MEKLVSGTSATELGQKEGEEKKDSSRFIAFTEESEELIDSKISAYLNCNSYEKVVDTDEYLREKGYPLRELCKMVK